MQSAWSYFGLACLLCVAIIRPLSHILMMIAITQHLSIQRTCSFSPWSLRQLYDPEIHYSTCCTSDGCRYSKLTQAHAIPVLLSQTCSLCCSLLNILHTIYRYLQINLPYENFKSLPKLQQHSTHLLCTAPKPAYNVLSMLTILHNHDGISDGDGGDDHHHHLHHHQRACHPSPCHPYPCPPSPSFHRHHIHLDCGDDDQTPCDLQPMVYIISPGIIWQPAMLLHFYNDANTICSITSIDIH